MKNLLKTGIHKMLNLVEFEWEIIDLGGEAPHTREELEEKKNRFLKDAIAKITSRPNFNLILTHFPDISQRIKESRDLSELVDNLFAFRRIYQQYYHIVEYQTNISITQNPVSNQD